MLSPFLDKASKFRDGEGFAEGTQLVTGWALLVLPDLFTATPTVGIGRKLRLREGK